MIACGLDVELDSLVPFLMDGFIFAIPGSSARMNSPNDPLLSQRYMTFLRKQCTDRYGLRLICITMASGQEFLWDLEVAYRDFAKKNLRLCGQKVLVASVLVAHILQVRRIVER